MAAPKNRPPRDAPAVHWCFTKNDISQESDWAGNPDADPIRLWNPETMAFLIYQIEKAPETGNLHAQGFVSMVKKQGLSALKKLDKAIHWEKTRGTPKQAADYCRKEESRIAGPWTFGQEPDDRGKKSATALAIEAIKSGASMRKLAEDHPEAFVRSYRGLQQLSHTLHPSPAWRVLTTTWIHGTTGVGKTRTAFASKCADGRDPYIIVMPGTWWDGYEGQDTIIFDDFYGQIRLADMLRWLDGYPLQLPVKGSFVHVQWTRVFITSNVAPDEVYQTSAYAGAPGVPPEAKAAFMRRLSETVELTAQP